MRASSLDNFFCAEGYDWNLLGMTDVGGVHHDTELQNKSLNKSGGSRKSESKIETPSQQNFIQKIFNKVIPKKKETMKEPKPSNRESIYKERRVTKIRARAKSFSQDPTQKELDSPLIDDKPLIQDAYAEELFR